jgi:hypothetical protein
MNASDLFVVRGLDFADAYSSAEVESCVVSFNSGLKAVNIEVSGPNAMPIADVVGPQESVIAFLDDYFGDTMSAEEKQTLITPYTQD